MDQYLPGLAKLWESPSGKQYGFPKDWDTVALIVNEDMLGQGRRDQAAARHGDLEPVRRRQRSSRSWPSSRSTTTASAATSPASTRTTSRSTGSASTPAGSPTGRRPGPASPPASASSCSTRTPGARSTTTPTRRFAQTFTWWRDMIHKGYMPSLEQARTLGQSAAFQSGKAALAIDGDWTIGTYSATKGVKVGYSPQPAGPKGSWSMYNGLADAIWVGSKHKPEARKWVDFLASQGVPEHRRHRGRRVPGDQVRDPEGGRQAQAGRHRRQRVHVLHRVRQHGALPDHRQGAADQPDRAADAGGVPQRQRATRRGLQEHERRRSTTSSSTRPSDARRSLAHLTPVTAALAAPAAATRSRGPTAAPPCASSARSSLYLAAIVLVDEPARGQHRRGAVRPVPAVPEPRAACSTRCCSRSSRSIARRPGRPSPTP